MTAPTSEASAETAATGASPDSAASAPTPTPTPTPVPVPIPAQASPADPAPVPTAAPVTPGLSGPLTIAADGSYAARLVTVVSADGSGGGWCPERWTLDGPEPYAVQLPGAQPEEPGSPVLPLPDGRVLIGRRADGRWHFSLLYPSGPDTGELSLGAVECERLTLLPPSPDGSRVYALVPDPDDKPSTALWLVSGGSFGPELVATLEGRCAGGAWLDREGRLLALDRTDESGRTRAVTVTVDAEGGGPPSELLRIAEDSNDRLLLADPDSGLLLVRSDAPGQDRIGWGVLGSHRPVRFPEALHMPDATMLPFAVQPGQVLLPESSGVALRMTTAEADWVAVWRPQQRELQHLAVPEGWLAGTGRWTAEGELLLPYTTAHMPCGLARIAVPVPAPQPLPPTQPPPAADPTPTPETPTPETDAAALPAQDPTPAPAPAPETDATAAPAAEPAPAPAPDTDADALPAQEPTPPPATDTTAVPATELVSTPTPEPTTTPVSDLIAAPVVTTPSPTTDPTVEALTASDPVPTPDAPALATHEPPTSPVATTPSPTTATDPPGKGAANEGVTKPIPLQQAPLARIVG